MSNSCTYKENGGVSSARNYGLDHAKVEWICFVDADDSISDNYCEAIQTIGSDMIILSYYNVSITGELSEGSKFSASKLNNQEEFLSLVSQNLLSLVLRVPWAIIILREIIGESRFAVGQNIGEDTLFMLNLYKKIRTAEILNGFTYYWQNNSLGNSVKYKLDVENAIQYLKSLFLAYEMLDIDCQGFPHLFSFFKSHR